MPLRHLRQQRLARIQHADAGRPVDLVAREGVEITVERLHIDTLVRDRLRTIGQHRNAAPVRLSDDLAQW